MGGALAVLSAVHVPEADCAGSWYGMPPLAVDDVTAISIPLQGHFAESDRFSPVENVRSLQQELAQHRVQQEFYYYAAQHAFGNDSGPNYDPQCTELAWQRTLRFFQSTLLSA